MNVDAFMQQAHEYAASSEGLDVVYKLLSTLALTHPMHTVRAAELQRWVGERRVRPDPAGRVRPARRRGRRSGRSRTTSPPPGNYYAGEARELATQVADAARARRSGARDAFRNAQKS